MSAATATCAVEPAAGAALPSPARVVAAGTLRRVRWGTAVVTGLAGVLPASVALQYRQTSEALDVASLEALAQNPAIRTLFGPPVGLEEAGGFTVWRLGTVLAVLVGTWAALTATRLTRGEEEAGRWDLLLSGRLPLAGLVRITAAVVLAAAAVPGLATAAGLLLAGTEPRGAVLFGAAIAGTGMTGAALGVLGAQLFPERRAASGFAVAVLLAGLLARMVGDGLPVVGWLQWGTPFGLLGRAEPYAADRWPPLLVMAALVTAIAVLAIGSTGRRDVGSARWRGRDRHRTPSRLVRSLGGLAVHRLRRPVLGWGLAVAAYFLLIGVLARSMTDFLTDNPVFAELAARAGFEHLGSVEGYAAAVFSLLAVVLGAFAASRIAQSGADENAGRLVPLLSLPVSRTRWALTEAGVVVLGCLLLAAVAAVSTWLGTLWAGAGLDLGDAVAGTVTVVPVALLCLGAALAALGWLPGAVLAVGVLPAAGGYLLLVFADTFGWPGWVRSLSPFAHLASVPAEPVDVAGAVGMVVLAVLLCVLGLAGYARRDLLG